MKKLFCLFLFVFISCCSGVDFVFKDGDLSNFIINKTAYSVSGEKKDIINKHLIYYFGTSQTPEFSLSLSFTEKVTKKSIEKNQVASKFDYEIFIDYALKNNTKNCIMLKFKNSSRFTFVPKSSGYNFASDKSLEKLYDLSIEKNIYKFISKLADVSEKKDCLSEN